jgi:hypothetical protein
VYNAERKVRVQPGLVCIVVGSASALSCLMVLPYRIVPCRIVPYRIVPYRVVSYRIVSCRIGSYRGLSFLVFSPVGAAALHWRPVHLGHSQLRQSSEGAAIPRALGTCSAADGGEGCVSRLISALRRAPRGVSLNVDHV